MGRPIQPPTMADKRVGGVRIQDWVGMAMVAVGAGTLVWFSWGVDPILRGVGIALLAGVLVGGGYLLMRRVEAQR